MRTVRCRPPDGRRTVNARSRVWHARCSTSGMPTLTPRDDEPTDYEQLRNHLARPRLEHPAGRQDRAEPVEPRGGISVMEWLLAVGHAVARKLRRAPRSAMVRLHPPE